MERFIIVTERTLMEDPRSAAPQKFVQALELATLKSNNGAVRSRGYFSKGAVLVDDIDRKLK
jgi:hypothetical protein